MTQLTDGEKKVLKKLVEIGQNIQATELAQKMNEKKERVISIFNSLSERGLIQLEIIESKSYSLTEEGEEYIEKGLPEIRLFNAIQHLDGKITLEEAIQQAALTAKEKGIAISWARKNKWIDIQKENGVTFIVTELGEITSSVRDVLSLVKDKELEPAEIIQLDNEEGTEEALSRSLLQVEIKKTFEARVNPKQLSQIQNLLEESSPGIANLTSEMITEGTWREQQFRPYNVELIPPLVNYGKKHPYVEFNDWLKEILIGLGFTEWWGPYVETEFWNFDTLFVPQDHVARDEWDNFVVVNPYSKGQIIDKKYYRAVKAVHENGGDSGSTGWTSRYSRDTAERLCLRAHTTPVSMRYLWEHREPPQKMFIIDRNFRSETVDAKHAMEFNQCEGIIMDEGLTLRDLLGYLTEICHQVGIRKVKYKPGQFPFTEPSVEVFAKHEKLGWIEVAPGGIFRPEVTYPLGIKHSVLAWGIGSGRLYMASMGINDIRELYSRDLTWLRRAYFLR
jgi:phenylalanyl-tRNA synthetase alpha chain